MTPKRFTRRSLDRFNRVTISILICIGSIVPSLYSALPGTIIEDYRFSSPAIALESLDLESFKILRKFNPREHLPEENWKEHEAYFLHRNRTVYLTPDERFAVKVWEASYPSSPSFLRAFRSNFYDKIANIQGVIFDRDGKCRGYITPYMISRTFHRKAWDAYGFLMEKNAYGVNIFSKSDNQPQNYRDFFNLLVQNSLATGIFSTDFCPNNVVLDPLTNRIYLIDLEDVLDLEDIAIEDPDVRMVLEYNPRDYLGIFDLYLSAE